jgi:hypothetical protein
VQAARAPRGNHSAAYDDDPPAGEVEEQGVSGHGGHSDAIGVKPDATRAPGVRSTA